MKHLFKTLAICGLFAWICGLATSCTPDVYTGPPVLEITGPAKVNNAVSVDIPVKALALEKVACYVREYSEDEEGVKRFVVKRDDKGAPVLGDPITKLPNIAIIFNKGKQYTCGSKGLYKLHLSGNEGLDRNKKFVAFIGGLVDHVYYNEGEILSIEFQTPDKYADNDVAVIREDFEGMDVYVTVPQHVKKENRRIKWGVTNLPMIGYNGNKPIPEMLHTCEAVYPAYLVKNDTLLEINHYNVFRRNKDGEIGYYVIGAGSSTQPTTCTEVPADDPRISTGEATAIQYYYHFTPGEPLVLLLAEVDYATCTLNDYDKGHTIATCDKKHATTDYGWGPGWYWFPYDMEKYISDVQGDSYLPDMGFGGPTTSTVDPNKYWHEGAWYRKVELRLPGPEEYDDGDVKISVTDLLPDSATITFEPIDKAFCYFYGIYEDRSDYGEGYKDIVNTYFDGDESLWQWFTTSEMGSYFGIRSALGASGAKTIKLDEYFATLEAEKTYHIVLNVMDGTVDDSDNLLPDHSAQKYQHVTFKLPAYTKKAPRLSVVPKPAFSPYKVAYVVKNLDLDNPVKKVSFVANYTRDFESYMNTNGYTYTDMVMMNASSPNYALSKADLEKVNSAEGCEVEFDVYEDSSFTVAMRAWNMEGRPSDPEVDHSYAVATSTKEEPAEALDMTKLNSLKDVWTAQARTRVVVNSETGETKEEVRKWKVTIGDLTSPDALTQENYELFKKHGVEKEAADAHFADLKAQEATYNASVLGQNRILCQGWAIDDTRYMELATPWDLFLMEDYNASVVRYLYHDFGPKWFLQTNADGGIFIPVNYNRIQPLTAWYSGSNHYLGSASIDREQNIALLIDSENTESVESYGLPVYISDDNSTIVIGTRVITYQYAKTDENGQIVYDDNGDPIIERTEDVTFYPNVLFDYYGSPSFYQTAIISEVTLTRGWTEPEVTTPEVTPEATPSRFSARRSSMGGVKLANIPGYKTPSKPLRHTVFVPQAKKADVKATTLNIKQPSREEIRKNMEAYSKKIGFIPSK